jgi:putative Mn2+ efflux pump MntP
MMSWRCYGDFFYDNFTWLASVTVYVAIVLTAMQVGLATDALGKNRAFQAASYGFTVFSIVGPLAAVGLIICTFLYIFLSHWVATMNYRRRRLSHVRGTLEAD